MQPAPSNQPGRANAVGAWYVQQRNKKRRKRRMLQSQTGQVLLSTDGKPLLSSHAAPYFIP